MAAVTERLPVWRVYRDCLRAWRRDFWRLVALATMVLLPLIVIEFALYGVADISLTTDDSLSLWIVSVPVVISCGDDDLRAGGPRASVGRRGPLTTIRP